LLWLKTQLPHSHRALRVPNIVTSHPDSSKNSESLRVLKSFLGTGLLGSDTCCLVEFYRRVRGTCSLHNLSPTLMMDVLRSSEGPVKLQQTSRVQSQYRVTSNNVKVKAVPLQTWSVPEGFRKLRFPDFMTTVQDGGKVVSLRHRSPLPPRDIPGTHFR